MIKVGQRFKETRLRKGLTIDDVAKATKIKAAFLHAIEKGDYAKLPSSAYAQGFVKNYCIFLGLPQQELLAIFRREFDERKIYEVLPEGFTKNEEFSTKRFSFRTIALGVFFFLFLFGYIFFQYKYAIFNPPLIISSPKEKEVISVSNIDIVGKSDPNATVYVNTLPVSLDKNGKFKKTINVFPGKEAITVRAVSRFGRETVVHRQIEVKSSN